jgi:tRNA(Ile)-lysidine synthase
MSSFLYTLAATLERLQLRGTRIVVGVSGGADSVALLCGLHRLASASQLDLHAAHLNHGLRPGQAEEDAEWTRALCGRLRIPISMEEIDVAGRAGSERSSIEEAARSVRYEFLGRVARTVGATHLAVAHHADDQVETVLHHLFRGTGLAGLRGMKRSRPLGEGTTLVRPLLAIRRVEIENWLAEIGQDYRTDATNADVQHTRNLIRHKVLPALTAELGPQIEQSVLRLADQADELQSSIEADADHLLTECLADESAEICRLNVRPLAGQPRHLVREVFVTLWRKQNWPRQSMGFDDWDRLYQFQQTAEAGRISLPGKIEAVRRGSLLVLSRATS